MNTIDCMALATDVYFPTVLEAGEFKIVALADFVFGMDFWFTDSCLLCVFT